MNLTKYQKKILIDMVLYGGFIRCVDLYNHNITYYLNRGNHVTKQMKGKTFDRLIEQDLIEYNFIFFIF